MLLILFCFLSHSLKSNLQSWINHLLWSLELCKTDWKRPGKEVMGENWSSSFTTRCIDICIGHFITVIHDICNTFAPERMLNRKINIIPNYMRILIQKVFNCLIGTLQKVEGYYYKNLVFKTEFCKYVKKN